MKTLFVAYLTSPLVKLAQRRHVHEYQNHIHFPGSQRDMPISKLRPNPTKVSAYLRPHSMRLLSLGLGVLAWRGVQEINMHG